MRISGHGNAVAIALAGLAVVLAATGTAYAVTATTVKIADAKVPAQVARVDSAGRLVTTGPYSTIDSAGYLVNYTANSWNYLTSPTTATLGLTRIRLSNPSRNVNNNEQLALYKVGVTGSTCNTTIQKNLGYYDLGPGQETVDAISPALIVSASGTSKFCLAVYVVSTDANQGFYVTYSLTAYAVSGSYSGIGVGGTQAANVARSPKIKK